MNAKAEKMSLYLRKVEACMILAAMNKKKITSQDIRVAAKLTATHYRSIESAWRTFQESGGKYIDYRVTTNKGSIKMTPTLKSEYKARNVSLEEAGDIILEYMRDSKINSRKLCNNHQISVPQFYSWIRELNVSGTLLGKRILDPKKYAKLIIKDVIWFAKRPNTSRKSILALSAPEVAAYKRVATVLQEYLPSSEKKSKQ